MKNNNDKELYSGWVCDKVDGTFKCVTFSQYNTNGFDKKLAVDYKDAFGREPCGMSHK